MTEKDLSSFPKCPQQLLLGQGKAKNHGISDIGYRNPSTGPSSAASPIPLAGSWKGREAAETETSIPTQEAI